MNASITTSNHPTLLSKLEVFSIFELKGVFNVGPFILLTPYASGIPYAYVYVNVEGKVFGRDDDTRVIPLGKLHLDL